MLSAVLGLADALRSSLRSDARTILGGDLELRMTGRRFSPAEWSWLKANSARQSSIESLRAAVFTSTSNALVEVRAIDSSYPLFGELALQSSEPYRFALLEPATQGPVPALISSELAEILSLEVGELLQLGSAELLVRALVERIPDPNSSMFLSAPVVYVSRAGLERTGLNLPGALRTEHIRLDLAGQDPALWQEKLAQAFPDSLWRVRDTERTVPGLRRVFARLETLLLFISLGTMLIAGICLANSMRGYLRQRLNSIAVLKSLGMPAQQIRTSYLLIAMAFSSLGILLGLPLGYLGQDIMVNILALRLPIELAPTLSLPALGTVAAIMGLTAWIFVAGPLHTFCAISPSRLFSLAAGHASDIPPPTKRSLRTTIAAGLILAALVLNSTSEHLFLFWFVLGGAVTWLSFRLLATALIAAAGSVRPHRATTRIALRTVVRSGNQLTTSATSLGIGLTALLTIALTHSNFDQQLRQRLTSQVPPFYLAGLQAGDRERILVAAADQLTAEDFRQIPVTRAKISRINGTPVSELDEARANHWILRSDRYITWSADPANEWLGASEISAGSWWAAGDQRGQVSFDADIGAELGLKLGDQLNLIINGNNYDVEISSMRTIDWGSFDVNFVLILSAGPWASQAHNYLGSIRRLRGSHDGFQRTVVATAPSVTPISTGRILATVNNLLSKIARLLGALTLTAIGSGILVLTAALAEGHQRRAHDSIVLRLIGSSRAILAAIFRTEFTAIAALAALPALVAATAASYALTVFLLEIDWRFDWLLATLILGATFGLILFIGLLTTVRLLKAAPLNLLRNE